ncbi:MAG: DoxX family protein [Akkermansiaceae bacterium]|nr:DoxX family protein [Akkermansiaceae bacterium]
MSDLTTRKPRLLLLLTFLLRVGMGMFFIITGLLKISGLDETAEFLTRSRLLPEFFSMPLACIGVAMELVVGVCLLLRLLYRGAALWGSVMTSIFILLYLQAWIRGLELSCNCLGSTHEIVNYPLDTGMRLLLLGGMLILVWESRQSSSYLWKFHRLDFSDV